MCVLCLCFIHYWDVIVLLGYESENGKDQMFDNANTPSVPPKRQKQSLSESDTDWNLLASTQYHEAVYMDFKNMLNLNKRVGYTNEDVNMQTFHLSQQSSNSVLFPYIHIIHFCLHLLYEELKLNTMRLKELPLLAKLLSKLAGDLGLKEYVVCYWKDYPTECFIDASSIIHSSDLKKIIHWSVMSEKPYFLMEYLCNMLQNVNVPAFPYIPHVNPRTRDIVQVSHIAG